MADLKISELNNLTGADPILDMLPIVDVSATPPASGSTKRISINNILSSSPTASGALTVTGLVTAGSATITGAATVGTTLGVTGNLTASSNVYVPASTTFKVGPVAGTWAGLRFDSAKAMILDSDTTITFRVNGGTSFSTAGSIDTSGNLNLNTGDVVMSNGKGISFAAKTPDGSGTVGSEVLNDYEEGTFTPTVLGSTVAGVGTYSGQSGIYTKVGRQVTVQIYLNWSAHTGTGNIRVGNLPFTNTSNFWSASVGYLNNIALTAGSVMTAFVEASASYIVLWQYPTGGGVASEVPIDVAGGIVLSASYTV
jgi:hypothetical protein